MKMIRVRIAVAVSPDGNYGAHGDSIFSNPAEQDIANRDSALCYAEMDPRKRTACAVYFVEVEVAVPEPAPAIVIEGTVVA